MKILRLIVIAFYNILFTSADPNLFGSRQRIKKYQALADKFYNKADQIESENPFDSAAAKSAMTKATKSAQQLSQKYLNTMGTNVSPEAKLSAMGQTQNAIASAAGNIAAGAEQTAAQQAAAYNAQGSGLEQQSTSQIGSGWATGLATLATGGLGAAKAMAATKSN